MEANRPLLPTRGRARQSGNVRPSDQDGIWSLASNLAIIWLECVTRSSWLQGRNERSDDCLPDSDPKFVTR